MLEIQNLNDFTEIYKIELQALPNQSFDSYLNGVLFNFEIRTYYSNRSTITIYRQGELICEEAPFIINRNLNYFSDYKDFAIFFLANKDLENYNYSNIGEGLGLYYGEF